MTRVHSDSSRPYVLEQKATWAPVHRRLFKCTWGPAKEYYAAGEGRKQPLALRMWSEFSEVLFAGKRRLGAGAVHTCLHLLASA